jgi:hypothetical protein
LAATPKGRELEKKIFSEVPPMAEI